MESKYRHAFKKDLGNKSYLDSMLIDNLPEVVSENTFTKNFMLAIQKILATGFEKSKLIGQYFKF